MLFQTLLSLPKREEEEEGEEEEEEEEDLLEGLLKSLRGSI